MSENEVYDCIYDEQFLGDVRKAFPQAIIEDASDSIHEGRFSVRIPDYNAHDWFKWLLQNGVHRVSLTFELTLRMKPDQIASIMDELNPGWRVRSVTDNQMETDTFGLKGRPPEGKLTRQGVRDLSSLGRSRTDR